MTYILGESVVTCHIHIVASYQYYNTEVDYLK
jgi:hypothetical protein